MMNGHLSVNGDILSDDDPIPNGQFEEEKNMEEEEGDTEVLKDPSCDPEHPKQIQFQDISAAAYKIKNGVQKTHRKHLLGRTQRVTNMVFSSGLATRWQLLTWFTATVMAGVLGLLCVMRKHLLGRTQRVTNMAFSSGLVTRWQLLTWLIAITLLVCCDATAFQDKTGSEVHIKVDIKYSKDLENMLSKIYRNNELHFIRIVKAVPGFEKCFNTTYWECNGQTIATIHVCRDLEVERSGELHAIRRAFEERGLTVILPMGAPLDCKAVQQPSIALVPDSLTIQKNLHSNIVVACEASGVASQDQMDFKWYLGNDGIPEKEITSAVIYSETGRYVSPEPTGLVLHFKKVQMEDAGCYTCKGTINGRNITKSFNLEINESVKILDAPTPQRIVLNREGFIKCDVSGRPSPRVKWDFQQTDRNTTVGITSSPKYQFEKGGLRITNVTSQDEGIYICKAFQQTLAEFDSRRISVEVVVPPKPKNTVGFFKKEVRMFCSTTGRHNITYEWFKGSSRNSSDFHDISQDSRISVSKESGELVIRNLQRQDEGFYTCEAVVDQGDPANPDDDVFERMTTFLKIVDEKKKDGGLTAGHIVGIVITAFVVFVGLIASIIIIIVIVAICKKIMARVGQR